MNRLTDRCDSCNAEAFVRYENSFNHDLLFCAHHNSKFEFGLLADGFKLVEDEREKINVRPSMSANAL